MRILLVSTTFYESPPKMYAGTEYQVWVLAEELNKLGHKVSVVAPVGSRFSKGIEHIPTVVPQLGNMQEDAVWPNILLPRLVDLKTGEAKGEFDVVHERSFTMWSYMAAKDHPDVKVCATVDWQMHWHLLPQVQSGEVSALPPVPHANLIGISNAHSLAVSAALGVPVEYVYNGLPVETFPFQKEKGDRFLYLGRIARFKGPHLAIHLADKLGVPLDVCGEDRFVGDPSYVHQVMNACRRMAVYRGEVRLERKLELLKNAKAVLFPAIWPEPFGLVPIEANACGTPVVALDYPGSAISEIIEDGVNGFLCKTLDEMAAAMKNVGDIKPEECRRVVEEKFTARLMAERYVKLYGRVAAGDGW